MHVAAGGDAGADVEELADADLGGQVADDLAQKSRLAAHDRAGHVQAADGAGHVDAASRSTAKFTVPPSR